MTPWYFTRITSDLTSKQKLSELLNEPYLISKEYSKRMKLHYHCVHQSKLTLENLKDQIYQHLPNAPKGIHTLKIDPIGPLPSDLDTACTYTVKDSDYIYSSYFEPKIQQYLDNSYSKPKPYPTALKTLIEEHTDKDYQLINFTNLKIQIAILRSQYHLEIYKSKIEALVLSIQISLNHNVAQQLFSSP